MLATAGPASLAVRGPPARGATFTRTLASRHSVLLSNLANNKALSLVTVSLLPLKRYQCVTCALAVNRGRRGGWPISERRLNRFAELRFEPSRALPRYIVTAVLLGRARLAFLPANELQPRIAGNSVAVGEDDLRLKMTI